MRSSVRSISALGAVFFAAIGISACGGGIPGNAVVQVNGTPVTKATFEHWLTIAAKAGTTTASAKVVPDPPSYSACVASLRASAPKPAKGQAPPSDAQLKSECEQEYNSFKSSALAFLIQSNWIIGQAKEMGINATNAEVNKVFNRIKKQSFPKGESEFVAFKQRTGQTVSDLELRVKVQNVLEPKIEQKIAKEAKKNLSKSEVASYYEQHKSLYGQPERRNLLIVLTKTEAQAKSAKAEIQSGKSFASVAKAHSIDPVSKAKGGELPNVQKGQEEKALSEAVFSAKKNVLSGPVKTPFGYYVFEVKKVLPASQQSLSSVESAIKQQVSAQRQQQKLTAFVKEFRIRWKARTECRPEFMIELCNGYKAPTTTGAGAGGGASSAPATSTSKSK